MYNYKKLIGELLGAAIGVVWICFGLLVGYFDIRIFLVVCVSLTIILGVLSGGFLKLSKIDEESAKNKEN